MYEELDTVSTADGGPREEAPVEYPTVDFTRERVIVREGPGNQAISWTVAQGDTALLGLLSCRAPERPSCVVNVIAVPASITRAEARTCDPVACGMPNVRPPARR